MGVSNALPVGGRDTGRSHLTHLCALGLYGTHGLHLREQVRHAQRIVHVPEGVHEGRVALAHDMVKGVLVSVLVQLSRLSGVVTPRALAYLGRGCVVKR